MLIIFKRVFINKMDLEGRDPTTLLDEVEAKLDIQVRPLSWPISQGHTFQGVYNLYNKSLRLFQADKTKVAQDVVAIDSLEDNTLDELVGEHANTLRDEVELIEGVYDAWDRNPYLEGKLAPVFFGSAVNNFGVQEMLDTFVDIAPNPKPRATSSRLVAPDESKFTGFIFKIHANIDPKYRDRIAFLRVCSGNFERRC